MKWSLVLAAAALLQQCSARIPKVSQLEAENEELKARNRHLEAMMQVARTEVQKLDAKNKQHGSEGAGEDSRLEVENLKKKLNAVQSEKKSLVSTLKQLLAKNSTKILRKQAENAAKIKEAVEAKCSAAQEVLKAQIQDVSGKFDDVKELSQTLQEQNMNLQKTVHDLRDELGKTQAKDKALADDKLNLVGTMHGLMRETSGYKKELEQEKKKEFKLAQELATSEAKLANATASKKNKNAAVAKTKQATKKVASRKPVAGKAAKMAPMHLSHEESMASRMAKLKDINRYIDRADMPDIPADNNDDDANHKDAVFESQEDIFARDQSQIPKEVVPHKPKQAVGKVQKVAAAPVHHSSGVSDWLGLKAAPEKAGSDGASLSPIDSLDPEATKKDKATAAQKSKEDDDDGGDGIENLLAQAKDQLSAMDAAEASGSN